ncbi:MAG: hypothetical protein JNM69_42290 [Archangium sp.]|nr:hypothetical protein [Archangium sp.]
MSTANSHEQQVSVLLDDMRGRGFTDDDVRRVELALLASRMEHVTLVVEPEPQAEYPRLLPIEELERLAATNPREMYEPGWRATAIVHGRDSRPIANHALLFLHEHGVAGNAAWHIPERAFSVAPSAVSNLFVYSFEHIDVHSFERHPAEVLDLSHDQLQVVTSAVGDLFEEHGWEGDGDIRLLWLPPFAMSAPDTWGIAVWHVKQSNNGVSWLAADQPLRFPALTRAQPVRTRV